MKSICFVATSPFAVNAFLLGHLRMLSQCFHVTLCVNTYEYPLSQDIDRRVRVIHVPIARKISLLQDIATLFQLAVIFWRADFSVVHSITPKGGALAMLASFVCRIPNRIHTYTGQVWVTRSGTMRGLLKLIDLLIARLATAVLSDSVSQSRFLERELRLTPGTVGVLGEGSMAGVDTVRFCPSQDNRWSIRQRLKINQDAFVFLFVGRVVRDKGVFDLVRAFRSLSQTHSNLSLWVVGPDEEGLVSELKRLAGDAEEAIRWVGPSAEPEVYMAGADLLVLPSYREGFGLVVAEAAGCGLPTIAYRIDGITDAVEDGITGVLIPLRDVEVLTRQMGFWARHADGARQLGSAARQRVVEKYAAEKISKAWLSFYNRFA